MQRSDVVAYCLAKPGAYLDAPWGDVDSVVKVGGKVFVFLGGEADDGGELTIMVRNSREGVIEWRTRYPDHIGPGPYMKKDLWSRVVLHMPDAPDEDDVRELLDDSYDMIVARLPKRSRPTD